ncbi:Peroxidase [Mycena sanguinolenta]|uniref:Peroxidase n=1 Tax=Mycena sanguinolenta TaxID=230812 RepID=A0A8H7CY56_9AGAR|nr:Peroxidase [Mycena sanguinolenta]
MAAQYALRERGKVGIFTRASPKFAFNNFSILSIAMKLLLLSSVLTALAAVASATLTCSAQCYAASSGQSTGRYSAVVTFTVDPIPEGGATVAYHDTDGIGGLDSSIRFAEEQARDENVGDAFPYTINIVPLLQSRYVSGKQLPKLLSYLFFCDFRFPIADSIALLAVTEIENCHTFDGVQQSFFPDIVRADRHRQRRARLRHRDLHRAAYRSVPANSAYSLWNINVTNPSMSYSNGAEVDRVQYSTLEQHIIAGSANILSIAMKLVLLSSVLTALAAVANATLTCSASCSVVSNGQYNATITVTASPVCNAGVNVVRFSIVFCMRVHAADQLVSSCKRILFCDVPRIRWCYFSLVGSGVTLKEYHFNGATNTTTVSIQAGTIVLATASDKCGDPPVDCVCAAGTP